MEEVFISNISIKEVRNVRDLEIPLSTTERKHLILTGKNGSGKTSVLEAMNEILQQVYSVNWAGQYHHNFRKYCLSSTNLAFKLSLFFNTPHGKITTNYDNFLLLYWGAKRAADFITPKGIQKLDFGGNIGINQNWREFFVQYLVNLQADKLFAKDEDDNKAAQRIDQWFTNLERHLANIFQAPELRLIFDRKNYTFNIAENGHPPYPLLHLPDGYSSILSIVAELILRMEHLGARAFDLQGVVLIDELETHLHVDLQKRILPFLIAFFPKIQFIVTTHSPFVVTSVSNAVVCDLEKKMVLNDLSGYSYEAIVESYFDSDNYSEEVKSKLSRLEELSDKEGLTDEELEELDYLEDYFDNLPKYAATELEVRLQQLKLKKLQLPH